jgi:orotate phosphoribosyltransferase
MHVKNKGIIMLQSYQRDFIQLAISHDVLLFGEFTLKSGRHSPYFFNAGQFHTGAALSALGHYYAQTIVNAQLNFDGLFGPAYKGIPLVSTAAIALSRDFQIDKPFSFNRKEAKDHGEGGQLVGAPLKGNILIIDDVISAGTATRESVEMIQKMGATVAGVVIAMDRQERGTGEKSAVQELAELIKVPVISIIKLNDIQEFMEKDPDIQKKLNAYYKEYGSK